MAITEPGTGFGLGEHQDHGPAGRRRVRPQRREDLRHLRRALRRRRRLGDPGQGPRPGRDQVVRGAQGHAGHERRAARAQARHQGVRHRDDPVRGLPGARREPARLARGRRQAGLRRRDGDVRQHPPAGGRDGGRLRQGVAGPDPRPARAGRGRGRLRPAGAHPVRGRREVPPDGGRLGGRAPADAAGRVDGRQPPAELARGVDGQGQGRPGRLRHHAQLRRARRARSATARPSCSRSGPATPRSSTSSRAPSRSSS